jgi:tetratricopeptide (TPR) repeat protein
VVDDEKTQELETLLRKYLVDNPTSADAHLLFGYVLFREQKAKESLAEFTVGSKFRRPRSDELKIVAADYVMLGALSDADTWLSQVVAETPNDPDSWYLLGRTKYSEGEFPAAISAFERALSLRSRHIEAENNIGLCWKELNDREKARAAFQAAIDWQGDFPSDAQPFLNLGTLIAYDQNNSRRTGQVLSGNEQASGSAG